MAITFTEKFKFNCSPVFLLHGRNWSTTLNPTIPFLPGENTVNIAYNSTVGCLVDSVRVSNPLVYRVVCPDWMEFELTGDGAAGLTLNESYLVGDWIVGESSTKEVHITVELTVTNVDSAYVSCAFKTYFRVWTKGHVPTISTEYLMRTWSDLLWRSSYANLVCRFYLGACLVTVPGRDLDDHSKCLFCLMGGGSGTPVYENLLNFEFNAYDNNNPRNYYMYAGSNVNSVSTGSYVADFRLFSDTLDLEMMASLYDVDVTLKDWSEEAGEPSEPENYNPSFDGSSDTIAIPDEPTTEACSLGFYNVYKMSQSSLTDLGAFVFGHDVSNVADAIMYLASNAYRSQLVNYIVSCHTIPVEPTTSEGLYTVHLGGRELSDPDTAKSVSGAKVSTDYVTFDCGTISLEEYYGNFADFLDNCKLFLPFIGFVPARPEWFKRTSLTVKYRFNVIDGSCVAFVLSTGKYVNGNNEGGTIVGQYSGTASIRFPVTALNYSGLASGVIGAVGGMATAAGAGSLLGVAGSAVNMAQARPDIVQSNGYNASASMMGVRKPYLYIERPVSSFAKNYQHELGIPANVYGKLGSVSGFVKMENVHLDGIDLTDAEKNELQALLRAGVVN